MTATQAANASAALWATSVRSVKGLLESLVTGLGVLLYYCGLARPIIRIFGRAPRVLVYHACQVCEDDIIRGLSINTTPARLAAHLDFLQAHYHIAPLASLTDGTLPDRAVIITFDDGFRSVYDVAFPLLSERKVPATCYLVTDVFDGRSWIWVLELNWYLQRHRAVARPLVEHYFGGSRFSPIHELVQTVIRRYDPQKITDLLAALRARLGPATDLQPGGPRLFLDRAEIEEMAWNGFTFGSHSASHAVLSKLGSAGCRDEIGRARRLLESLPGSVDSLAYPFGIYDETTRMIAVELGYTTLMEVEGDNVPLDSLHVGRLNVTSVSPAVLFARLELTARMKFRIKRLVRRVLVRLGGRRATPRS
jgi:peptidoglycan/xylan/chitin deacetylase (PgdA/CDA1 family)